MSPNVKYEPIESTWKLYKRRWVFLIGLLILQFFAGISFSSYGQISDFYVKFFNASHAQVDWITNARNISAIFITFPLAWLVFKGVVRLRCLILIVAVCSTSGLFLVTISLLSPHFFPFIVIGQVLCGLSETVGIAVPSIFAVLWFPESQVGTAIAINIMGVCIGDGTGYLLPPTLVYTSHKSINATGIIVESQDDSDFMEKSQHSLLIMYGSFLAISAVVSVFFFIFITDKPPSPPTTAQYVKNTALYVHRSFYEFLQETKSLILNRSYILICIVVGFVFQIVLLENLMMSEIIKTSSVVGDINPAILSGFIMSLYSIGSTIGLGVGGKIVDKCKRYKMLAIVGTTMLFLSTVGIAFGVQHKHMITLLVSNGLFGFFSGSTEVVIFEIATQQTYPKDETMVNTWMTGIQTLIGFSLGIFGRIIFTAWGSIGVLVFQSLCIFVCIILVFCVSSRNRRLEVSDSDLEWSVDSDPTTPLITN